MRALRASTAVLALWCLGGCVAVVPDARAPVDEAALARLPIAGPSGPYADGEHAAALALLLRQAPGALPRELLAVTATLHEPVVLGNSVQLLIDGPETHSAMYRAIHAAREHVNLATYTFESGGIGEELVALLVTKLAQGVRVSVSFDSAGSFGADPTLFSRLRDAGARVCEVRPVNPLRARGPWRVNQRDHRKLMVVDGETGFTGGINVSGVYKGSSRGAFGLRRRPPGDPVWRDTHVEVRGPAVAQLQRAFVEGWTRHACGDLPDAGFWPALPAVGEHAVRVLPAERDDPRRAIHWTLATAVARARERVFLTQGYFIPDEPLMRELLAAAARGVDVRVVLPGFSDVPVAMHAGRTRYARLLAGGVRLYERRDALLHAKTAVIDGSVSLVGSANVDPRSLLHNDESSLLVLDAQFGFTMEVLFARDMSASVELDGAGWARRGWLPRAKEAGSALFSWWL